jgi:hypothetical protein
MLTLMFVSRPSEPPIQYTKIPLVEMAGNHALGVLEAKIISRYYIFTAIEQLSLENAVKSQSSSPGEALPSPEAQICQVILCVAYF